MSKSDARLQVQSRWTSLLVLRLPKRVEYSRLGFDEKEMKTKME